MVIRKCKECWKKIFDLTKTSCFHISRKKNIEVVLLKTAKSILLRNG